MSRSVHSYALDLLAGRAYTTHQLRRKLTQKEFDPIEVDSAIERLLASGLLDDPRYAAEYAYQKLVVGGASARRVEQDLARKGIAREVAKAATSTVVDDEQFDTLESVRRVAGKKLNSMGQLDPTVKRRRLFGFLARRGYNLDDINRIIVELL